ncbi:MAG: histidyl-tRNA synthetase, partial [Thermoleophilaceae bacterium]|nr:histidyl-tRNA synthetase [Thermoleophilaceae bacterium]
MAAKITAPRGTFDVLGPERLTLRRRCEEAFARASYGYIETPAFEATDLFARGVGATTDIVQKEMFT